MGVTAAVQSMAAQVPRACYKILIYFLLSDTGDCSQTTCKEI